ncbi:hypothetical protein B7463_g3336, partial [Scytalidium lignicola]
MSESKFSLGKVSVISGCGFVGSYIVDILRTECKASVYILSRNSSKEPNKFPDVQYFDADISSIKQVLPIFEKIRPDVVINTVSPPPTSSTAEMFWKINVEGTRCLLDASKKTGVKAFVYTSSSTVIKNNPTMSLENADETWPVITGASQKDPYLRSKAEAENMVIAAHRQNGLLTCALCASAIFGERDRNSLPGFVQRYNEGKTGVQIGDNSNIFDWTYVGNHAYAHILAADALLKAHSSLAPIPENKRVDGEVFYTTNDEPRWHFWDLPHALWVSLADAIGDGKLEIKPKVIPLWQATLMAYIITSICWLMGKKSPMQPAMVSHCCRTAYFNNSKAKERLGYRVRVPLDEAVQRSVKWCIETGIVQPQSKKNK